ncbi:MAG: hypothetical protein ACYTHK_01150 [Planctomycetota bacterium]|jgi:hypothetical protein
MAMESYHERCGWPFWFHCLLGTLTLGTAIAVMLSGAWPALLGAAVLGWAWYRFAWVELRVGAEGVEYGFRGLRNRVPRDRISGLEVEKYRLAKYLGWGWRIGGKRDRAYSVIGPSSGVRLRFEDEQGRDWSIFVSSRAPESAVRAAKWKVS